jgi:hypothetical protein
MQEEWLNQYWWLVFAGLVWELTWKGMALWKAARNNDKPWFVLLLLINALGLLSIAYIFVFSKRTRSVAVE